MHLSAEAARALGCLVEKAMTTPGSYPMSLNAVRVAANQSTNRDPVVDYDDTTVTRALTELQDMGLARAVHVPGQRVVKYKHAAGEVLELSNQEVAVLAVLLLRGEQTPGELRGRTERYVEFDSPAQVAELLAAMASREDPLVEQLERRPGEKESRWRHLLTGDAASPTATPDRLADQSIPETREADDQPGTIETELAALRREIAALRDRVDRLESGDES